MAGVGAVLQWAMCVCVCLCVCPRLVSSQGSLPSTFAYTFCFSLTATRPDRFLPSLRPSIPRPPPVDVCLDLCCLHALGLCFHTFPHRAPGLNHPWCPAGHLMSQARLKPQWEANLCPPLLSDPCGWVAPQKLLNSVSCGAGEQIMAAQSRTLGPFSAPPIPFCKE